MITKIRNEIDEEEDSEISTHVVETDRLGLKTDLSPLSSSATLGELFSLSKSQFSSSFKHRINSPYLIQLVRITGKQTRKSILYSV